MLCIGAPYAVVRCSYVCLSVTFVYMSKRVNIFSYFFTIWHLVATTFYTVSQKHATTLTSCSFDKHGLIVIIFAKQHQHTFEDDMFVQLSLSLHFYLLYLLLNSCDGIDAFWRSSMLVKQSSSFSRKHRTLSLEICVRQTLRLTTEFVHWCRNMFTLYKHLSMIPAAVTAATWSSASLTHEQAYHKTSSTIEAVGQWRKRLRASMMQNYITLNIC